MRDGSQSEISLSREFEDYDQGKHQMGEGFVLEASELSNLVLLHPAADLEGQEKGGRPFAKGISVWKILLFCGFDSAQKDFAQSAPDNR